MSPFLPNSLLDKLPQMLADDESEQKLFPISLFSQSKMAPLFVIQIKYWILKNIIVGSLVTTDTGFYDQKIKKHFL